MRVFVIGSGRCGTVTFSKAASHCTNFTVGHETKARQIDPLDYPDNHIEVSSHLTIYWPMILEKYPDCKLVWLYRVDRLACAKSIAQLQSGKVVRDYCNVFHQQLNPDLIEGALDIYDMMNAHGKTSGAFHIELESASSQWKSCWDFMGCEGDFETSLKEWDVKYNAST